RTGSLRLSCRDFIGLGAACRVPGNDDPGSGIGYHPGAAHSAACRAAAAAYASSPSGSASACCAAPPPLCAGVPPAVRAARLAPLQGPARQLADARLRDGRPALVLPVTNG